ncbi:MAG: outer membrane beta-barrel protein [Bacteroidales bacterium]|nr:outer membrane beta-barrel protein [Bacteroidales bacterium]
MKQLPILLLLCLASCSVQAQRIHAFVSSGVTLSQIEGDELKGFKHVGFTGGVGALTALSDDYRWGLSVEALFSQRGVYNNSYDPQNYYNIDLTLNYVDIPVLLHFQDPYGGMLFGAGLSYGRLVQQPHGVIKYNPSYFIPDTSDMTFLRHDLCAVADMRFTIWRGLQLNIRFQHSLLAVKRDWTFYNYNGTDADGNPRYKSHSRNCYNQAITFRLIWQF